MEKCLTSAKNLQASFEAVQGKYVPQKTKSISFAGTNKAPQNSPVPRPGSAQIPKKAPRVFVPRVTGSCSNLKHHSQPQQSPFIQVAFDNSPSSPNAPMNSMNSGVNSMMTVLRKHTEEIIRSKEEVKALRDQLKKAEKRLNSQIGQMEQEL